MADVGSPKSHWDTVWETRQPDEVTWFQDDPSVSLELITRVTEPGAAIIDVGGGASRLVDGLLDRGYSDLTVLDIAAPAFDAAKARLGDAADAVDWIVGDATNWNPTRSYDLWHDRAVLHFFVDESDRAGYVERLRASVVPGGHVVLATFGPDGPEMCSGLPVRRYGRDAMTELLGAGFAPLDFVEELHPKPTGGTQAFLYGLFEALE